MNKIITINLAGQAIAIDEKAYEVLRDYLHTLERHFRNSSSGQEILEDIEGRIAEMFQVKLRNGHQFINMNAVDEAIELMGSPSDMGIDEEEEPSAQTHYTYTRKKLYRDSEDKLIGGVCSGIAAYLDVDVSMVRLVTLVLVLFGGLSIIPYLILWIILPETRTPEDRFRMRGERPNIDEIARRIRNEAENVANNLKKNETINRAANETGNFFRRIGRGIGKFFGGALMIIVVIACVAIFMSFLMNMSVEIASFKNSVLEFPMVFESGLLTKLFYGFMLALVLIPIGAVLYVLTGFIFDFPLRRVNLKAIFGAWLLCLAVFIGISIFGSGQVQWDRWEDRHYELYERNSV